jgi:hypothetical protein
VCPTDNPTTEGDEDNADESEDPQGSCSIPADVTGYDRSRQLAICMVFLFVALNHSNRLTVHHWMAYLRIWIFGTLTSRR